MFYQALGDLIGQAGDAIAAADARASESAGDARDARESRQIGLLLRRARGVWPLLFETLQAETRVLEVALAELDDAFDAHGEERVERGGELDPLARYRDLERSLDRALVRLCEREGEAWAKAARAALRARLAEAAEVQGRLTDAMLAIR